MNALLNALLHVSRLIDAVNLRLGRSLSWLVLVTVLISAVNATVRKVFGLSSNAWLELQWVLFSVVFLLCAPWTLLSNEHVRIDIINTMLPKRLRNAIEVIGHIVFLLPLAIIMLLTSLPFFLRSYAINEQSANAGGLPQWPAKSLIFIGFALLLAQGISELIKRVAVIRGLIPDPHESPGGPHPSELEAARLLAQAKSEPQLS